MEKKIIIFFLIGLVSLSLVAQTDAERKEISKSYDQTLINQLTEKLNIKHLEREARINGYLQTKNNINKTIKNNGKTYEMFDIVNGKPVYRSTHNINSAKASKTNKLHTGGSLGLNLEGLNMSIGVWDEESVRGTHDEFKDNQVVPESRVVYPEFFGPFFGPISDHATHVAGTLIGKGADADAKGMAPQATLRSFDWSLDDTEALSEANSGLLVSNHSYGVPIFNNIGSQQVSSDNIGAYTSEAKVWDDVAFVVPYYLAVNSAGNEGSANYSGGLGTGYDKLTGNKTAKNNLVVANTNPFVTVGGVLINFPINSNSSQGPTDDFRIKPDISGDGTNVYSPVSTSDSDYDIYSGTSMASPNVAGTLLLLQEYYNQLNSSYMRASTLKGLVCHTAIDDPSKIGPDPIYGWGLLNAEASANVIKNTSDGVAVINEIILSDSNTYTYQFSAGSSEPIIATICWTDPSGAVQTSPMNVLSPRLVNDLDLRLEDESNTVFSPWKLDNTNVAASAIKGDNTVDNIERINIESPTAGSYTLTVSHKGTLTNGSQVFSLIITGANLLLSNTKNTLINALVWPNPVEEFLNIRFNSSHSKTMISVYSLLGNKVYQEKFDAPLSQVDYKLNTSKFSKGIYLLQIKNGDSVFNKKLIIK